MKTIIISLFLLILTSCDVRLSINSKPQKIPNHSKVILNNGLPGLVIDYNDHNMIYYIDCFNPITRDNMCVSRREGQFHTATEQEFIEALTKYGGIRQQIYQNNKLDLINNIRNKENNN